MESIIEGLIEGGKASGGPPLGPALGPLGVNINAIVGEINERTKDFSGIRVAVKVFVDTDTKKYRIEVGTPSTSALILKELKIQKGAKAKDEVVGNITIEQIKKIANAKSSLYGKDLKSKVKQVLGTCKSMGITCEGETPKSVMEKLDSGEMKL